MAKSLICHSAGLVTAIPKETATKSLLLPFPFPTPSSTTNRSSNYRSVSSSSSSSRVRVLKGRYQIRAAAETMEIEKSGIKVVNNPPESKLAELGVRSWPKWGCPPSKFPWTYSSKETCYLLKGKVKVTPEGSDEGVEFGAGDLVVFPKGMNCTWDVSEAVDKHYMFE